MSMKSAVPVMVTAAVLAVVAGSLSLRTVLAQEGPPAPRERGPGGPGPGPGGAEASVNRSMKGMGRALKGLKSQIADASKKSDCLKLVNDFQRGIVSAKGQGLPDDLLEGASDVARERRIATYRNELIAALKMSIELEIDIVEGRTDAAGAKIESLAALRDDAHDKVGLKEE